MADQNQGNQNPAQSIVNALNQLSLQIAQQTKTINQVFPQIIGTSTSGIQSGAIVPLNYTGFLNVTLPSTGVTVKVPYYTSV